ncbi:MAG: flavodoxin family protein [Synergistaceae bacterium]|jgi:multimeric flavodoxin WrbA|nr:flavodoxin family protein [Synergistaceae bacterium]
MDTLNVVAFNGSPRENGNTSRLVKVVFSVLESEGISAKEVRIGNNKIRGCAACGQCREKSLERCAFDDDPINGWIEEMKRADGIILASPTYFANLTTEMKALIDRAGFSCKRLLRRKVGAPVVMARRGGAIQTYNALMAFFGISEMMVPGSSYWNMGYGLKVGDVEKDEEAKETMKNLGANMAWLLKKLHA